MTPLSFSLLYSTEVRIRKEISKLVRDLCLEYREEGKEKREKRERNEKYLITFGFATFHTKFPVYYIELPLILAVINIHISIICRIIICYSIRRKCRASISNLKVLSPPPLPLPHPLPFLPLTHLDLWEMDRIFTCPYLKD